MSKTIKTVCGTGTIICDDDWFEDLSSVNWILAAGRKNQKYAMSSYYRKEDQETVRVYMHRLICGALVGEIVDHINGNRLDNRRANLRIVNDKQNALNRGKQRNNTSGYKGVTKHTINKSWCAEIKAGNKRVRLNGFSTPEDAAIAYNYLAIKYHGEFAVLNEI